MTDFEKLSEIIKKRRSVYPEMYKEQEIADEIIYQILENANWAPTHKKTQPWRFKIFKGASLEKLGEFLSENYKKMTPEEDFSPMKYKKTKQKPLKSACVIAICMQRDPEKKLPEWEEKAAVACAVQNLWLSCHTLGIGGYWGTPGAIHFAEEFLNLENGESCMGFFFMGYMKEAEYKSERGDVKDKVRWM